MLYEERHVGAAASVVKAVDAHLPQHDGINICQDVEAKENKMLGISITNATAQWTPESHEKTLNKVMLDIRPGMLVAVIGPVGAGKVRTAAKCGRLA
jgi:ABC-type multidrug transport system fused ATPase/permease subunit